MYFISNEMSGLGLWVLRLAHFFYSAWRLLERLRIDSGLFKYVCVDYTF